MQEVILIINGQTVKVKVSRVMMKEIKRLATGLDLSLQQPLLQEVLRYLSILLMHAGNMRCRFLKRMRIHHHFLQQ